MNCRVDAFILALSQHYRLLKEVIWDGKSEFKLIPDEDAQIADSITELIESVGGKGLANYCRLKFQAAWFSYNLKAYDIRKILEYIRDNGTPGPFVDYLKENFERLVHTAYRLSNPIEEKHRTKIVKPRKRRDTLDSQQLLLFPEEEMKADSPEIADAGAPAKKTRKPRKPRKPRVVDPNKPKKPRKPRIDKLADEIIDAEYGDNQNNSSNEDFFEDHEEGFSDTCDHYSRGYSRMNDRDFGYFSGHEDY